MGVLQIPDHSGHTEQVWDKTDAASLRAAQEKFDELVKDQKMLASEKVLGATRARKITEFNPDAEAIAFHRHLVGG